MRRQEEQYKVKGVLGLKNPTVTAESFVCYYFKTTNLILVKNNTPGEKSPQQKTPVTLSGNLVSLIKLNHNSGNTHLFSFLENKRNDTRENGSSQSFLIKEEVNSRNNLNNSTSDKDIDFGPVSGLSDNQLISETKLFLNYVNTKRAFSEKLSLILSEKYCNYIRALTNFYEANATKMKLPNKVFQALDSKERKIWATNVKPRLCNKTLFQELSRHDPVRSSTNSRESSEKTQKEVDRLSSKRKNGDKKQNRAQFRKWTSLFENSKQLPRNTSTPQSQEPKVKCVKNKKTDGQKILPVDEDIFYHQPIRFHYYVHHSSRVQYGLFEKEYDSLPLSVVNLLHKFMPPRWNLHAENNLKLVLLSQPLFSNYVQQLSFSDERQLYVSIYRYLTARFYDIGEQTKNLMECNRKITIDQSAATKSFNDKLFEKLTWFTRFKFWLYDTSYPLIVEWGKGVKHLIRKFGETVCDVEKQLCGLSFFHCLQYMGKKTWLQLTNVSQASILPGFPLTSAITEEVLRPVAHKQIIQLEKLLGKSTEVINFHEAQLKYSLITRIKRHIKFNFDRQFVNQFSENLVDIYNQSLHSTTPLLPLKKEVQYTKNRLLKKSDLPWAPNGAGTFPFLDRQYDYEETPHFVFPLLFPITCMQSPTNSSAHFDACISVRILGAKYPSAHPLVWESSNNFFPMLTLDFDSFSYEDWEKSLKVHQLKRIQTIKNHLDNSPHLIDKSTTVFCKSDEMLPSYDKFVPRFIANVSPYYLYRLGYFITVLQQAVADAFDGFTPHQFVVNGKITVIYVLFACGKLSSDLDAVWNFWINNGFRGIMVMGDDSLFFDPLYGMWETDYSKFDASQKRLQALDVLPSYMEQLGFPTYAKVYREMYDQPIKARQRNSKIIKGFFKGHAPELEEAWKDKTFSMRLTGEPATCLANSLVNIFLAINCWRDKEKFSTYGVQVKFSSGVFVTFLKGVFLYDTVFQWTRLPSFLLKFGKVLTNPSTVCKKQPYHLSVAEMLHAQWLGYGDLKNNNWFYAAIDVVISNLCSAKRTSSWRFIYQWKIYSNNSFTIDNSVFNAFMLHRYDITVEEMLDYLQFLMSITELPCVYTHPIMNKLLRDYI